MKEKRPIVYYVSAHKYGHGVRSSDIIRALHGMRPDVPVIVTTALPPAFIENRLRGCSVRLRPVGLDVGMVQLDSIRMDVDATYHKVQELCSNWDHLVCGERDFLRAHDAAVVVADIPAIPIEAAKQADIPAVAVGNFAWNWIYSPYANSDGHWVPLTHQFAQAYQQADLLIRLPFAEPMTVFPVREDIPLVAKPGNPDRARLQELTGCREDSTWVLLSFTQLAWAEAALNRIEALHEYDFFTVKPLVWRRSNIYPVDREQMPFSDVLASVDVVVSKPGFGLLSECIVNQKPLVFTEREDFMEYPLMLDGIRRYLKHFHVLREELYAGRLETALKQIECSPCPPERALTGGARLAAERILGFYD